MLDVARNRLHRMELWFTLISMALAFGALVGSLFGMNIESGCVAWLCGEAPRYSAASF